jgi:hypothetical protein
VKATRYFNIVPVFEEDQMITSLLAPFFEERQQDPIVNHWPLMKLGREVSWHELEAESIWNSYANSGVYKVPWDPKDSFELRTQNNKKQSGDSAYSTSGASKSCSVFQICTNDTMMATSLTAPPSENRGGFSFHKRGQGTTDEVMVRSFQLLVAKPLQVSISHTRDIYFSYYSS